MVAMGPEKAKKNKAKSAKVYKKQRSMAIENDRNMRKHQMAKQKSKQISTRNKAEGKRVRKLTKSKRK